MIKKTDNRQQPRENGRKADMAKREHWSFKFIAVFLSLLFLVLIDVGLRTAGIVPPDDPLVFHVKTHMAGFTPFVELADGRLSIKKDWEKRDETYRFTKGTRAGRLYLHPGFRPASFARQKAPGTLRIFALGGSTTFGQWVGADHAFPAILAQQLQADLPDQRLEVINLGCPGLESTRVSILLEQVLRYAPDLVVVYTGHNEMLMGPDITVPAGSLLNTVRAHLLRLSTLAAWFNHSFAARLRPQDHEIVSEETAALQAGKILPQIQNTAGEGVRPLPADYRQRVTRTYALNLRKMASAGREAGIPLVFVLPNANLLYPPEQSAHAEGFTQVTRFSTLLDQSRAALQAGEIESAGRYLDQAIALSPEYAMARHLKGTVHLKAGQMSAARQAFQQAVDLNAYTHRLTTPLQTALIDVMHATGSLWVDLRPHFQEDISFAAARSLFVDHCHPTRRGHRLIAAKLLPAVKAALGI